MTARKERKLEVRKRKKGNEENHPPHKKEKEVNSNTKRQNGIPHSRNSRKQKLKWSIGSGVIIDQENVGVYIICQTVHQAQ